MDRTTSTNAIVSLAGLLAQGTAELQAKDEEIAQLRLALAQAKAEVAQVVNVTRSIEQLNAELDAKLRSEEERRVGFQAVDAAARRFTTRFMQENPRKGWQAGWRCPAVEMKALLVATGADPTADHA